MAQPQGGATLRLEGVSKRYGQQFALKPTELAVRQGEFLTLLGPSGSGKTTLLSIVAGLVAPDSGDVWIGGARVTGLASHLRDIGMVFQNYALFPHLSVFENIAFPLRMRRLGRAEIARAVQGALELVQLPHLAPRLPGELSGGQQQRIALARCLVYRPSVILMDEPLGALDRRLRESIQQEIKRLHAELGPTILYVTHDQDEALALSDRICLMNHAHIAQVGTPEELYRAPNSVFAAEFLGESNVFEGALAEPGVVWRPDFGAVRVPNATGIAGDRVRWMVRPERLALIEGAPEGHVNSAAAAVSGIGFGGGLERIVLRLAAGTTMKLTRLAGGPPLTLGAAVTVAWRVEDTVALAEDDP